MSTNTLEGSAERQFGRLEEAVGDLIGDGKLQAKGMLDDAAGAAEQVYGLASETAQVALSQVASRARNARGDFEDLVSDRPILATGITLGIGIAIGVLLIGSGRAVHPRPAGRPPKRRNSQGAEPNRAANRRGRAAPAG
jgi:uncharacterized protein YjbJ (UPF0337 family)